MEGTFNTLPPLAHLHNASHSRADIAKARAAAQDFEAQFLAVMLDQMHTGVGEGDPFSGGASTENFRSMLNEEYARSIAEAGGIGVADSILAEILRLQEAAGMERQNTEVTRPPEAQGNGGFAR